MFGPSGFWTMAPLRYAAKLDPFLSLDCAPTPSTLAQSKERKGSNFTIWQPCFEVSGDAAPPYIATVSDLSRAIGEVFARQGARSAKLSVDFVQKKATVTFIY